jgi:thiol-disulfide isomerase/thioredoxin
LANQQPVSSAIVAELVNALADAGKEQEALQRIDSFQKAVESGQLHAVDLARIKIRLLTELKRGDEAGKLMDELLTQARQKFESSPDDAAAAAEMAHAMVLHRDYLINTNPEQAKKAAEDFRTFLSEQIARHKDNADIFRLYFNDRVSIISETMRDDAEAAERELHELGKLVASLNGEGANAQEKEPLLQFLMRMQQQIDVAKKHSGLVGQDAIPLGNVTWVNGSSATDDDLKGKVVLLDFWAVWCGPCIATFPHLRDWHERFQKDGLEIVGVTRHYEYDWDESTKRPKRVAGLEPAAEEAALVKFAEHHQLKHRFAVTPSSSTVQQEYGVTGIPQAVLIDRQGKVRMVRVGSGEANAQALEKMIVELLAESAPSGN